MKKDWKLMELVVGALERVLMPGARVEVDQKLKNLRTGRKTQCDCVIRSGKPPRETLTIVEVQKRSRAVEYGTFSGWCRKRENVGASHLICVSEKPFPESVVIDAKTQGQTVRLMTLAELEGKDWPLQIKDRTLRFLHHKIHEHRKIVVRSPVKASQTPMKGGPILIDAPIFRIKGEQQMLSLNQLAMITVAQDEGNKSLPPGDHPLAITYRPPPGKQLDGISEGVETPISSIAFEIILRAKHHSLPMTCSGYVEMDYKGAHAYAMTASGEIAESRVDAWLIFRPSNDGLLRYESCSFKGLPGNSMVELKVLKEPPKYFDPPAKSEI